MGLCVELFAEPPESTGSESGVVLTGTYRVIRTTVRPIGEHHAIRPESPAPTAIGRYAVGKRVSLGP